MKKIYTEEDYKKMLKKIHKMMKRLNYREVIYNDDTKGLLNVRNNYNIITPLCYVSQSRPAKKLRCDFDSLGRDSYSYEEIESNELLRIEYDKEVVDGICQNHIPYVYETLKKLWVYIYISGKWLYENFYKW